MTDGPRQRGSAAASSSGDGAKDEGTAAGESSVALKKEIGLVSACGIIVGECNISPFRRIVMSTMRFNIVYRKHRLAISIALDIYLLNIRGHININETGKRS